MKVLKVLAMAVALSATTIMPGMAFEMEKDSAEWSSNPDCMVTMYLGMPSAEYENNFSDIKGWKRSVINNYNVLYPCHHTQFLREEPAPFSNKVIKQERLISIIREDWDSLEKAEIYFCYRKKENGANYNYKKEVLPAIQELQRIQKQVKDNMIKKYGQPTKVSNKKTIKDNSGRIIADEENTEWIIGDERYSIFYGASGDPRAQTIGTVAFSHTTK